MDKYEELERGINPHRDEERSAAAAEIAARLRQRGIALTGAERSDDLADLVSAVERFEAAGRDARWRPDGRRPAKLTARRSPLRVAAAYAGRRDPGVHRSD
jgi:hypothetical protein